MNAITKNQLEVVKLLMNGNRNIAYSYDDHSFNIIEKSQRREYAIKLETLKQIEIMENSRIEFIMSNGSYLYINLFQDFISVGLI